MSKFISQHRPLLQAWKPHCIFTICHNLQVTFLPPSSEFPTTFQVLLENCFAHIWGVGLYCEYHSWKWNWVLTLCKDIVIYLNQFLERSVYPTPVYFLFLVFPLNRKNRQLMPGLSLSLALSPTTKILTPAFPIVHFIEQWEQTVKPVVDHKKSRGPSSLSYLDGSTFWISLELENTI